MMEEDYVSFKIAKKLKEKGFPKSQIQSNVWYYDENGNLIGGDAAGWVKYYQRPTLYIVQKWLREEKSIGIDILSSFDAIHKYWYYDCSVWGINGKLCDQLNSFTIYEEALEAGIKKALEFI